MKKFLYSLSLAIASTALFMQYIAVDAHALSYLERQRCDYVFSEYAFTQVDRKDYPECSKRFDYLTKRFQSNFYSVWQ